ncbi:ankyrin repeat protein, putative [Trichomonas vaginalis G3]|uniref:Ankyrin repeat protein, putative n=1 Tax=Trichomonas vaginalis (strain ATCC PRA-98 / G3) TaxID=412133 RepID=A2EF96_TRIV3|nr:protein ubiquitination [Trichomonas vaginalis G3]EAY08706.1 ankyrin repeat protein, putative [Trichomonas vaginalis G3]KAI5492833.1 protein ubiquitination [Trichomonas vaginalis G3]|eukprot:XP_001320929.1 ankyrin repeat protein [Trichomonas vaginalis G3]
MIAAKNGDYDLVSLFIDDGVEFSKRDNNGMTAFMIACGEGHLPVVKLLADYVKEANDKDKEGKTALHHACMHNFWKIVEFLLSEFNMDQSIKDNTGKTAKMYCTDAEVLNLLL